MCREPLYGEPGGPSLHNGVITIVARLTASRSCGKKALKDMTTVPFCRRIDWTADPARERDASG
jgi:hypothetical protein